MSLPKNDMKKLLKIVSVRNRVNEKQLVGAGIDQVTVEPVATHNPLLIAYKIKTQSGEHI
jgi:hypothetical protein